MTLIRAQAPLERSLRREIAQLHRDALPGSLLNELGPSILEKYYSFITKSGNESLFLVVRDSQMIGTCTLSYAPESLMARFFRQFPLHLGMAVMARSLHSPALRRAIFGLLNRGADTLPASLAHSPEVVQLFVKEAARSCGIGGELLHAAEAELRARGVPSYYVKTEAVQENRATSFYQRAGFQHCGGINLQGQNFLLLAKNLL